MSTKAKISIKCRFTSKVLFEGEYESIKDCVVDAVKKKANLRDANLGGTNLRGANLQDANLRGANLRDANLGGTNLQGANLRDVNLRGANLCGADLRVANLRGANLGEKYGKLIGERPIFQIGNIGSSNDFLISFFCKKSVVINRGCFLGTLEEFEKKVKEVHGDNNHGREYQAAIQMIKTHNEIWNEGGGDENQTD